MKTFQVNWESEDGYVTGARPQYCSIGEDDIKDDMTDEEIEQVLEDIVQQDFDEKVSFHVKNRGKFISWAKGVVEERKAETN